ncbi:putative LIPOPROTEIN LPQP [Labilithrix luteola]|uniref:Putative LIPOPROTEIN LPQP n=2 Tax=Labilithrix luteola TaxID=1391654 RepID=A0A0K1QB30_9BACT|nr:putative LIPOPROTEIN LPQP [Labilithrix luteola]
MGCSVSPPDVGTVTQEQTVAAGKSRTYHLSVPAAYQAGVPTPLVFVLHGAGDTNPVHMREWFDVEAHVPDALYVYPQALVRRRIDGTGGDVPRWDLHGDDDTALFDAVVSELSERYCVDRTNVLATGFSSGGNFANQLACLRQSEIRAIGAVSGPGPFTDVCGGAVGVWMTHDTGDNVLPIADARRARDFWARENACGDDWVPDKLPMCRRNAACPPSAPLVYCETSGIGHEMTTFAVPAISDFFGAILKTSR